MSENLRFDNYSPLKHGAEGIYRIGSTDNNPEGVAIDMAKAFGFELASTPMVDNLGDLIGRVGSAKELQDNIEGVKAILGTNDDAVSITRGWSENSGLLSPVERTYLTAEKNDGDINLAIISGGVRNWMERRTSRLEQLKNSRRVESVLLVAGNREMKTSEGPDVEDGMTEADYMKNVIALRLGSSGISLEVLRVDSEIGNEVMKAAANKSIQIVDMARANVSLVSNAGAWVQNGGQYLRAAKKAYPKFDIKANQFEVVSDSFELGTGIEPTSTHQNPFSTAGQIARNLQEFTRHTS